MIGEAVYTHIEGLMSLVIPGVLGLVKPDLFVRFLLKDSAADQALLSQNNNASLFLVRLFSLTAFALGGTMFYAVPEVTRSTKKKLLGLLLLGDVAHLCVVAKHLDALGGWNSPSAIGQISITAFLGLNRLYDVLRGR